ncbi:MAG: F0F1 ATP synthase subunit epsilon [Carboxydocellales bacterium]
MAEKSIKLDIVTPERIVYSQEADFIVAPGSDGQLGVLPGHAALITSLDVGILKIKANDKEEKLAISGGFFEIKENKAVVLAETAERSEDIDITRAIQAKERAEQRLATKEADTDLLRAEASLKRAMTRLRAVDKL